jgi:spore coat protein CotH
MRIWQWVVMLVLASMAGMVRADNGAGFWSFEKVWTFHVTVGEADWERMQPQRQSRWAAFFGGGNRRAATQPATRPAEREEPVRERGPGGRSFGEVELPYVFGTAEFEGMTFRDVGVRFKGNSSYALARQSLKKPFKLDFNRYLEDGAFPPGGDVTLLNFNNNAMDPSQIREAVAYKVFRDAGVPAPRTTFARVHFSVPNEHDRTFVGLYTIIEEVNKEFLKEHFGSSKGLLLKPEGVRGFEYHGEEWRHYHDKYDPRGATSENTRRFAEFLKLVDAKQTPDEAVFRERIGGFIDDDAFARFVAVNVVLSNTDSFLAMGHNYYMYLDPKGGRIHFVPWDLNLSMGGFMLAGSVDQQADLSIDRPHAEYNNLVKRMLAIDDFRERYRAHVRRIVERQFTVERMSAEIGRLEGVVAAAVEEEKKAGDALGDRAMGPWKPTDLRAFVENRVKSIEEQLAGRSAGTPPKTFRGPVAKPEPETKPARVGRENEVRG